MQILETLKLKSRLLLVFVLITMGLIFLGLVGTINTKDMKKRIDNLYFGTLMPVTELHEILYMYNAVLSPTVYKTKYEQITTDEMEEKITMALKSINKKWQSYKNHYKSDDELPYVNFTTNEIEKTNRYFQRVLQAARQNKDLTKLSVKLLESKVEYINTVLKKLLDYELNVARYDRKGFLESYNTITKTVSIILVLIIFGVLFVTYYVF
jgi:hypothetical protein